MREVEKQCEKCCELYNYKLSGSTDYTYNNENLCPKCNEEFVEDKIEDCLVEAHNLYVKHLLPQHSSDIHEWVNAIHDLQKLMMIRKTRRDYPDKYYHKQYMKEVER